PRLRRHPHSHRRSTGARGARRRHALRDPRAGRALLGRHHQRAGSRGRGAPRRRRGARLRGQSRLRHRRSRGAGDAVSRGGGVPAGSRPRRGGAARAPGGHRGRLDRAQALRHRRALSPGVRGAARGGGGGGRRDPGRGLRQAAPHRGQEGLRAQGPAALGQGGRGRLVVGRPRAERSRRAAPVPRGRRDRRGRLRHAVRARRCRRPGGVAAAADPRSLSTRRSGRGRSFSTCAARGGDSVSDWTLVYRGFDPAEEGLREALCTLGNGYFATRGAGEEVEAGEVHYPGTYLAGGYDRLTTDIAGRTIENEDLVNMPNWLPLCFQPEGGDWFNLMAVELLEYCQELDLRAGLLRRSIRFRDRARRESSLTVRRLVHMGSPHLAAIEWVLTAHGWSGRITVRTALDGQVINAGVARYRELSSTHLVPKGARALGPDAMQLVVETRQSRLTVAEAARTRVYRGDTQLEVERRVHEEESYVAQELSLDVTAGEPVRVEKVVALYTGRDRAISEPVTAAAEAIAEAGCFAELAAEHTLAWAHLWGRCDVLLEGEERMQMILRLH